MNPVSIKRITAPVAEPITLTEAKAQARFTSSAEDTFITELISQAREFCESNTGLSLMPQTWELTLDDFADEMHLHRPPVTSITSIKYTDVNGVEQTLASTEYVLDSASDMKARVVLAVDKSWPDVYTGINNVRIRYVAGYANAAAVPKQLKRWMLIHITDWFKNRESIVVGAANSRIDYFDHLLDSYKIWNV